jgi:hypothetical protein
MTMWGRKNAVSQRVAAKRCEGEQGRVEDRVEEERERADHDHDLEGDDVGDVIGIALQLTP